MTKSRIATVIVFLIGIMLALLTAPLWADDGHGHHHGDSDVTVDASSVLEGSVSVAGDSSRAFGFGLGDVDINDCYRSYQVLVWQDSRLNRFCVAQHYVAVGNEAAYAQTMCSIKAIRNLYDDKASCVAAHKLAVIPEEPPQLGWETPQLLDEHQEEEQEFHVEQQMLYEDLQAKIRNLQQEQESEAARRRAASRAAAEKEAANRQYAQEALEELAEWK